MDPETIASAVAASQTDVAERPGRLWAISDLHLSYPTNRDELQKLKPRPNDGLIICGDVGERPEHLHTAFKCATDCFRHVFWAPGNHELYTPPTDKAGFKGEQKYEQCVAIAREYGVKTPEDDYMLWQGEGGPCLIAPIFTLYDYSFRPADIKFEDALDWAREQEIEATDEHLLHPDPWPSRQDWCEALVARTERKLEAAVAANPGIKLIIAGHWPLREDLVHLPMIPRFSLWCGTKKTEDWHNRFSAKVVVSGHLHIRRTDWKDNTRFEECSLGYPRQWQHCMDQGLEINDLLREILPGPPEIPPLDQRATVWRKYG
ncbi:ser/Thr protein phosphatase family protein [Sporormia fimetaria CBS 119925]|uniref:Ser/Thr protein phosphatase family protein n=1 Tax=Sporormia fimetaria CBS 119925 TaxID=1340428 RepID=A0A6A6VFE1_9PLEO|nr:ser/Thr protein phosphatase family protein [Sporormia fimetaria CBS 119925]